MSLDNQVNLLRKIISLSKEDISTNIELDDLRLEIDKYRPDTAISFLLRRKEKNYIIALVGIYYQNDKDRIVLKQFQSNNKRIFIDNISSILQDYEELDINQFILIHGREPFGDGDFLLDIIYYFMEEFDHELGRSN